MSTIKRIHIEIQGTVQGVGFRPFVYRLAHDLDLAGWVSNSPQGVQIEIEGAPSVLEQFMARLHRDLPAIASITQETHQLLDSAGYADFTVRESGHTGDKSAIVLPDLATCDDCRREIFDPSNRRYRYPFTNCTNCGPRYSIIESLPYDRINTSMKIFAMCPDCRQEYENPADRRFHAQPNACPACGPHVELWDREGKELARNYEAILQAVEYTRVGKISAFKGLGGFLLLVDARSNSAVSELRRRKQREEKPLAVMFPNLDMAQSVCHLSPQEAELLQSPASPIVLAKLRRNPDADQSIAESVAPDNPCLGIMLPYTPLHHLLMAELGFPIVATSGNLSDEPICIDEHDALIRLRELADFFLIHNRPIVRQVDDSVVRVICGQVQVWRNARGYAPTPFPVRYPMAETLAVGGHLKNSIAISVGDKAFLSQHIGDLDTSLSVQTHQKVTETLAMLYDFTPQIVARDMHPDYQSTAIAKKLGLPEVAIQHHHAHVLAGMADHQLDGPVLGISWDGTGWGPDGTVWGGEFLDVDGAGYKRLAHLRTFALPGGEAAVKEPRRSAIGILYEIFGDAFLERPHLAPLQTFSHQELQVIGRAVKRKLNSPRTSSAGRLFDAAASLLGLCHVTRHEGHAAMLLEFAIEGYVTDDHYPYVLDRTGESIILDWEPMMRAMLNDIESKKPIPAIAAGFHNTLVSMMLDIARISGRQRIILTGGCFQNRYLTEQTVMVLSREGFQPYFHRRIPPNDGGLAIGQLMAAMYRARKES